MLLTEIKRLFKKPDVSVCIVEKGNIHTFSGQGLKPLLTAVKTLKEKTAGAATGDKVVGKAAALILASAKIKSVYAAVLSVEGEKILKRYNIEYIYEKKVPFIENRDGTGMCPMEEKCLKIDSPEQAYEFFSSLIL